MHLWQKEGDFPGRSLLLFPVLAAWPVFFIGFKMMVGLPSLVPAQSADPEGRMSYSVTVNTASVHAAPDPRSPVIGQVQEPAVVGALDDHDNGDWRHVSGAGWDGWLPGTAVSVRYKILGAAEAQLYPLTD